MPTELPSSQPNPENTPSERRRQGEGVNVIQAQRKAVEEAAGCDMRRFKPGTAALTNAYGEKISVDVWVSDKPPLGPQARARVREMFKCEVCGKEFDKKQKMLLHSRFHK